MTARVFTQTNYWTNSCPISSRRTSVSSINRAINFLKCAKLHSPRRLVQFQHTKESQVVIIINCTLFRVNIYAYYIHDKITAIYLANIDISIQFTYKKRKQLMKENTRNEREPIEIGFMDSNFGMYIINNHTGMSCN